MSSIRYFCLIMTLLCPVISSDEYKFICKPKPGCNFTFCPIPAQFYQIVGFNAAEYRRRNKYHITCEPKPGTKLLAAGAKGDKGDIGLHGFVGQKGQKGDTNKECCSDDKLDAQLKNLKNSIQVAVKKQMKDYIDEKIEALDKRINDLAKGSGGASIEAGKSCKEIVPTANYVQWNGKCFWANLTETWTVPYIDGVAQCKANKANPANIYSKEHYLSVLRVLRGQIPRGRGGFIDVYLGMTFQPATKDVFVYNSSKAQFITWRDGYPRMDEMKFTQLYLDVRENPNSVSQGMANVSPGWAKQGILCEIAL